MEIPQGYAIEENILECVCFNDLYMALNVVCALGL